MKPAEIELTPPKSIPKIEAAPAYSDGDIDLINSARNRKDGYSYYKGMYAVAGGDGLADSGILMRTANGQQEFLRDDQGRMVIELPASASQQSSPIDTYLKPQIAFLKLTLASGGSYPVKILFPYKLDAWHWNVGEIILSNVNGELQVSGCKYDSYGSVDALEENMQEDIQKSLGDCFVGQKINFNFSKKKENITLVQTGQACGLYAAIAMHNLKTKPVLNIWDGVFEGANRKDEKALRYEDYNLIDLQNQNKGELERFCRPLDYSKTSKKEVEKDVLDNVNKFKEGLKTLSQEDRKTILDAISKNAIPDADMGSILNELRTKLKNGSSYDLIFSKDEKLLFDFHYLSDVFVEELVIRKGQKDGDTATAGVDEVKAVIDAVLGEIQSLYDQKTSSAVIEEIKKIRREEISNLIKGMKDTDQVTQMSLLSYYDGCLKNISTLEAPPPKAPSPAPKTNPTPNPQQIKFADADKATIAKYLEDKKAGNDSMASDPVIKKFKECLEKQEENPQPNGAYNGIGARFKVVEVEGKYALEVQSTFTNSHKLSTGNLVSEIEVKGGKLNVNTVLRAHGIDGLKTLAQAFHSEEKSKKFTVEKQGSNPPSQQTVECPTDVFVTDKCEIVKDKFNKKGIAGELFDPQTHGTEPLLAVPQVAVAKGLGR